MNEAIAGIIPIAIRVITLLISVSFHEFFHAVSAHLQGDRTPHDQGRLSLNPLVHIDPIGSIAVPGILLLLNAPFLIGWAKPVEYNRYNLQNQKWGPILVSLAGPFANALLFVIAGVALKYLVPMYSFENYAMIFLMDLVIVNIALGLFNLIPIPPLDGSSLLLQLLPSSMQDIRDFIQRNAIFIFIVFILLDSYFHFLSPIIGFVFLFLTDLLGIPLHFS